MYRNNLLKVSLSFLALIAVVFILYLYIKPVKYSYDEAVIIKKPTWKKVLAKTLSNERELEIHSNIFNVNDKVKVKYYKNKLIGVEAIVATDLEKFKLLENIRNDVTIQKYSKIISGSFIQYEENTRISDFDVLPEKIAGQTYKTISEKELYEIRNYIFKTIIIPTPEDKEITFTSKEDLKILNITNTSNGKTKNISFTKIDKEFTFKSVGEGIYSIKLEFENGDIVDYIFI